MAESSPSATPVQREVGRATRRWLLPGIGEHKAEIIASIPAGEDVSLYRGRVRRPLPRPARALDRRSRSSS